MATFSASRELLKTCPYNPAHRVSASRFQQHLSKCAKNGLYERLVHCPHNALHRVGRDDLDTHLLECPDNRQLIREMTKTDRTGEPQLEPRPVVNPNGFEVVLNDDHWDDPKKLTKKGFVIAGLLELENKKKKEGDDKKKFKIKSSIEIQMMNKSERQKYYLDLLEQTRGRKRKREEEGNPVGDGDERSKKRRSEESAEKLGLAKEMTQTSVCELVRVKQEKLDHSSSIEAEQPATYLSTDFEEYCQFPIETERYFNVDLTERTTTIEIDRSDENCDSLLMHTEPAEKVKRERIPFIDDEDE